MSFFNEAKIKAMISREYVCSHCGSLMEFEDEWEDVLICPNCGHSIDSDRYGCESDEKYEKMYPTREEVCGIEEEDDEDEDNPYGETYDEVCGELDDD